MSNKSLLISGASGFVGSNLLPFLEKNNYKVSTIGRSHADYTWHNVTSINKTFESIIHLSGKAHDIKGKANESVYSEVNLGLTKLAFEAFQSSNSEVFIYFSSVKAVASIVEGVLLEDDSFEVDNPYGTSKRKAEEYLLAQKLESNKRLYILRPCMIHGPGNKGNLNLLYKMAKFGVPFPFAAFENERSLLGIENLKEVVLALIKEKPESGVYNLSDDGYISTSDIYLAMGDVLNKKLTLLKTPKFLINMLGKFGDFSSIPIDSLKIMKLTENYRVSNQKIKNALGWEKMPNDLRENLLLTIESFNTILE